MLYEILAVKMSSCEQMAENHLQQEEPMCADGLNLAICGTNNYFK